MAPERFVRMEGQTNLDRFVEALARCCARRTLDEEVERRRKDLRESGGRSGDQPLRAAGRWPK